MYNHFFIFIYSKYKLLKIIQLHLFYNFNFTIFDKNYTMNYLFCSTSTKQKKLIIKFTSSKKNKCQCGKTKDSNGNCDGSHTNK